MPISQIMTDILNDYDFSEVMGSPPASDLPTAGLPAAQTQAKSMSLDNEQDLDAHDSDSEIDMLGVDSEITARKRKPIIKLDSKKLLGATGLPMLARNTPSRLKLKGRGHEIRDLDRLLWHYQIWAHACYPKATFDDMLYLLRRKGNDPQVKLWRRSNVDQDKTDHQDDSGEPAAAAHFQQDESIHVDEVHSSINTRESESLAYDDDVPSEWDELEKEPSRFRLDPEIQAEEDQQNVAREQEDDSQQSAIPSSAVPNADDAGGLFFDSDDDDDIYVPRDTSKEESASHSKTSDNFEDEKFLEEQFMAGAEEMGF